MGWFKKMRLAVEKTRTFCFKVKKADCQIPATASEKISKLKDHSKIIFNRYDSPQMDRAQGAPSARHTAFLYFNKKTHLLWKEEGNSGFFI